MEISLHSRGEEIPGLTATQSTSKELPMCAVKEISLMSGLDSIVGLTTLLVLVMNFTCAGKVTLEELRTVWITILTIIAWIRLKKTTNSGYSFRVDKYDVQANKDYPELMDFKPTYGSSSLSELDNKVEFYFHPESVYPSKRTFSGNTKNGKIRISKGAIKADGSIVPVPNQILWENDALDETTMPNPLIQGALTCSLTGECKVTLSEAAHRL